MSIRSVNIGGIEQIAFGQKTMSSGINKYPVSNPVSIGFTGLQGDKQADLRVHGGKNKAVYAYPEVHYDFWKHKFPHVDFTYGTFGENLTISGYLENDVYVGDVFKVGSATLAVTTPRLPCVKLNMKFQTNQMVKMFNDALRFGWYFRVIEPGMVSRNDTFKKIDEMNGQLTIMEFCQLSTIEKNNHTLLEKAVGSSALLPHYRGKFQKILSESEMNK